MRSFSKVTALAFLAGAGFLLPACKKEPTPTQITPAYSGVVVRSWNEKFLETERYAEGYRPAPATRALAYLGLSAYEACIQGLPGFKSMAALYPGLVIPPLKNNAVLHWPTVVNASYAYLMQRFFPFDEQAILLLEESNNAAYQAKISSSEFTAAQNYGRAVAAAVWEWSKTELGHDAYLDPFGSYNWQFNYQQVGSWVPNIPGPGQPSFAYWGTVRTFAIQDVADKLCAAPTAPFGGNDSLYYLAQAMDVYSQSLSVSAENLWIAEFWNDDFLYLTFSTGSRWLSIANQVYQQEEVSLETALYCNAKLGLALHDATVAGWFSKFHYNRESPETLIRREIDPNWQPLLSNPILGETDISPNFPSYPSEYATMGAAAAAVLTHIFGDGYAITDRSHENAGDPRSFNSFQEMAGENAESRIIVGVNLRMDREQGYQLGYKCGDKVNALPWN